MRFIVTRQNADGSYDEVGMNNRRVYKSEREAVKSAREWAKESKRDIRVEEFDYSTFYMPEVKPRYVHYIQP